MCGSIESTFGSYNLRQWLTTCVTWAGGKMAKALSGFSGIQDPREALAKVASKNFGVM